MHNHSKNAVFVRVSMNNESSRHAIACHPPLGKEGFRFSVFFIIFSELNSNLYNFHYTQDLGFPHFVPSQNPHHKICFLW